MTKTTLILICTSIIISTGTILIFMRTKTESVTFFSKVVVPITLLLGLITMGLLVFNPSNSLFDASSSNAPSQIVSCTPSLQPQQTSAQISYVQKFYWFDEISPILEKKGNFYFGSWGDAEAFHVDARPYNHGFGMQISGTGEESVSDSPLGVYRADSKSVSADFALRMQYASLSFSIGADNGDLNQFGNEETNGVARVLFTDITKDTILFDTGWVNYSYARYDISLDISDVDMLRITYCTSRVGNEQIANPLRFAIVDPILVLREDTK